MRYILAHGREIKSFTKFIQEVGYSGRSVRNTDPIQYMIRSILSGDMQLNMVDKQPKAIQARILRDIRDIVDGKYRTCSSYSDEAMDYDNIAPLKFIDTLEDK
jgi:hypothetical protein